MSTQVKWQKLKQISVCTGKINGKEFKHSKQSSDKLLCNKKAVGFI